MTIKVRRAKADKEVRVGANMMKLGGAYLCVVDNTHYDSYPCQIGSIYIRSSLDTHIRIRSATGMMHVMHVSDEPLMGDREFVEVDLDITYITKKEA